MKPMGEDTLYIGTNYHPHDWPPERWAQDLDMMAQRGFTVVRLGHLCWDSFEPEEGVYTFSWMDRVMELCQERGIGVFLDIPTRPAPTWLHEKYPSIDIVDREGVRQNPHTRYMEDVGDPHFREYAYRLAAVMAQRYASHPALLAFGLCNELGSGFLSYSPTARDRFVQWLKEKYRTVENLNRAWATHRWSRKLQSFDQVELPIGATMVGAPERFLDMRRFYSQELVDYMAGLKDVVNQFAPGVPCSSNHWAENPDAGFDYNHNWRRLTDFSGQGFYPGVNPEDENALIGACFCNVHRAVENPLPDWNLEFQVGSLGGYSCPPGAMRMYAYLTYLYGSQGILAWTWRSMLGGEEQYLFGLLDHDGEPSWKLEEFHQIAKEAKLLGERGLLPRRRRPEIALAYSFEDWMITRYAKDYYTVSHRQQAVDAFAVIYHLNRDCAMVDLRRIEGSYKVLLLPGCAQMTPEMVQTIQDQLEGGATVIMTAFSAKVDEHNQVFDTSLPGLLTQVFGVKVRGFDRAVTHVSGVNEGSLEKAPLHLLRNRVSLGDSQGTWMEGVNYHEFLEPVTAQTLAVYQGGTRPGCAAVTCNSWGKGKAVYVGVPADESLLRLLLERLCGMGPAFPELPRGVAARSLGEGAILYVNTTPAELSFPAAGKGLLGGRDVSGTLTLPPYEAEVAVSLEE